MTQKGMVRREIRASKAIASMNAVRQDWRQFGARKSDSRSVYSGWGSLAGALKTVGKSARIFSLIS
jgi:hypothetical protein